VLDKVVHSVPIGQTVFYYTTNISVQARTSIIIITECIVWQKVKLLVGPR